MAGKLSIRKGDVYGKFTVVKELPKRRIPSGQINRWFQVRCVCGKLKDIRLLHLTRNRIKSCGCSSGVFRAISEWDRYIRKTWRSMKDRVSPTYSERHLYYDRGITVCDEWMNNYESFREWAKKNGLKKGLQIDRKDNNGIYEPSNCRAVTNIVNVNNRNNTRRIVYKGKEYAFMNLMREKGLENKQCTIAGRLNRGWEVERAVDTPIRKGNYRPDCKL